MAGVWLAAGDYCTGSGTGYYGCEAFVCQYGDTWAGVELLVVSPVLLAAMVIALRCGPRLRATIWTTVLCYLLAGRFAVYLALADVVVQTCAGL